MIFIVGGRGRLGQALFEQYLPEQVILLERSVYASWGGEKVDSISDYFSSRATPGSVIYICSGLLDPKLGAEELNRINFVLPANIIRAVADLDVRVVTFGTAMEGLLVSNPYVQSKMALARFIESRSASTCSVLHVRIHTLYGGGEPSQFMLLGLMLQALRQDHPFPMTQGRQLREYHHVEDDAVAILQLVRGGVVGPVVLSHGHPIALRSLAKSVFDSMGKPHLLQLGALPEPPEENFSQVFAPVPALVGVAFRDTLTAVNCYMKTLT